MTEFIILHIVRIVRHKKDELFHISQIIEFCEYGQFCQITFYFILKLRDLIIAEKKESVPIVIAGNKVDLGEPMRAIRKEDIIDGLVTEDWDITHIETSAKHNTNVKDTFGWLLKQLLDRGIPGGPQTLMRRFALPVGGISKPSQKMKRK